MIQTSIFDIIKSKQEIKSGLDWISNLPLDEKVEVINQIKMELHKLSPFNSEPVDCVLWVKSDKVEANDYNPNSVAPTEMELLKVSIENDGYTQPIVSWKRDEKAFEVVDGFHRNRVGKECKEIQDRIKGYLPLVVINSERQDKTDRIASTIRHNRARGKHKVDSMSDIVIELKRRNWSNAKISKELGMDEDEILRLCQIKGITDVFADVDFSKAWEIGSIDDVESFELSENVFEDEDNDSDRIYHTHDKWECFKAGFYDNKPKAISIEEGELVCKEFLGNLALFENGLKKVISEWKYSCEHYLTNRAMNRIAWLGQASVCIEKGIPSCCRGGFNLLNEEEQKNANELALKYLNIWLVNNNRQALSIDEAGINSKVNLY